MHSEHCLLFYVLDRYISHVRPGDGFTDGLCISGVVLVGLFTYGFTMAKRLHLASPNSERRRMLPSQ